LQFYDLTTILIITFHIHSDQSHNSDYKNIFTFIKFSLMKNEFQVIGIHF
jgi:hypothetical protein